MLRKGNHMHWCNLHLAFLATFPCREDLLRFFDVFSCSSVLSSLACSSLASGGTGVVVPGSTDVDAADSSVGLFMFQRFVTDLFIELPGTKGFDSVLVSDGRRTTAADSFTASTHHSIFCILILVLRFSVPGFAVRSSLLHIQVYIFTLPFGRCVRFKVG